MGDTATDTTLDDTLLGGATASTDDAADAAASKADDTAANDQLAVDDASAGDKSAEDKSADDKNADDKAAGDKDAVDKTADDKDAAKETGAPETYDLKLPEGVEVADDEMKAFTDFARELEFTNDQAQKILDHDAEQQQKDMEAGAAAYEERMSSWADATKKDQELGGEAMPENLSVAKKAQDAFATPELTALLGKPSEKNPDGLGLGNHPEVLRLFYRIGKAIGDDTIHTGGTAPAGDTKLERMYPTMKDNP